jgi:hypothetical protein
VRPVEEWADLKYEDGELISHIVPFGQQYALCGLAPMWWLGTGDFEEFEVALTLNCCLTCSRKSGTPDRDPAVSAWGQGTRTNPIQLEDLL